MIGETLAHYQIVDKLGEGGMGEVYLADDLRLKRRVALKVLPRERAATPSQLERFQREAEAIAALSHPGIVTVHSVEEATSSSGVRTHFLTMELVEGKTLARLVPKAGLPQKRLYDLAIQIADALAAAHARGITHRDLKPANVMVSDDGRVKVLDFGLAKLTELDPTVLATQAPTEAITDEGTVLGTYPYMSPEQAEGKALDARSDIFSFGILLYEMATGVRPFRGDSSAALVSSILKDEATPIEELNRHLPRQLGRIVRHCLEKDRNRRFQSALDLRNELAALRREVESDEQAASGALPPATPSSSAARGRPGWVAAGAVAVATLLAVLGWTLWNRSPAAAPVQVAARTVAVFPFQNLGSAAEFDYLRLAVPDEVTTALSRASGLAVRPFATTSGYPSEEFDPVAAGRAVKAGNVVTGQFFLQGSLLQLTMEAIDVERNQLLWRESFSSAADDLVALRGSVGELVRDGLLPRLGGDTRQGAGSLPADEQAYTAYLRGLAQGLDIGPNRRAIEMLEHAVELDPTYAPAWSELARRYYYDANYGQAGRPMYEAAVSAAQRALDLDPFLVPAAVQQVSIQVELGDLGAAWDEAATLLAEYPDSGDVHHAVGYVLRYAGLLEEALAACERALALDPSNPRFRSCGLTAYFVGEYERSEAFLGLDGGSQAFIDNLAILRIRQGRPDQALAILRSDPKTRSRRRYLELCLDGVAPDRLGTLGDQIEANVRTYIDGEQHYWDAAYVAYCGEPDRAARLLRSAVEHGYCSFPLIDRDPLLESLRETTDLTTIRAAGRACQERFQAHRASGP